VKARDVLAHNMGTSTGDDAESLLLVTTPDGEGVYIAPDGTLMRAVLTRAVDSVHRPEYRLLPVEGGDRA